MRRLMAAILAIPTLFNGLAMLTAGPLWYETVPGVSETGPFNPHFVQDIGVAFLVAGLALAGGHSHYPVFDLLAIVLPSAAALYSAFPSQGEHHA